ncbi:MAG: 2OG-Fe(II) oxygenase [Algoriphagus sp.]|jgi:SM-20-related protein|uniref:2OG-Fe(II) oxygenase n=1 Tax=Algoriphagus sp. TaxID=1872435 RepID=UPI002715E43A|nr:2OG-Fe(II) oxygenase [Algoriphagus sp.]MDO8967009.1 2OG-Fe(II) oxygenase [Algoriphagus sp.]MDP2043211.1 2OG-Fe(II) oxygenase [Algoriphagus sp.]MDP3199497.1 2OG-Fe(II) oxygenase [Algoriphagus sp.]MDP3473691.1 2OG-Fe(II) oxygenase [Algoriphagus sp.]
MEEQLDHISAEIYQKSYVIVDNFVDKEFQSALLAEQMQLLGQGKFRHAAVGKGGQKQVRTEIRGDEVHWMDADDLSPLQAAYWGKLEEIRKALNQRCFLGLRSFEGHFARYPIGSFYKRHLDQFQAVPHRVVTVILYLNDSWTQEEEGALRMYISQEDGSELIEDVLPVGGRLVIFLSGEIPHEVLPTKKERISITGWFRNID